MQGYRNIMENCQNNAMVLKAGLIKTERFKILSKDIGVPVVAFSLKNRSRYNEFKVSENLRRSGWIVPAYSMPADAKHVALLRVVIREDFSCTLAERLVSDITHVLQELDMLHPAAPPAIENGHLKVAANGLLKVPANGVANCDHKVAANGVANGKA